MRHGWKGGGHLSGTEGGRLGPTADTFKATSTCCTSQVLLPCVVFLLPTRPTPPCFSTPVCCTLQQLHLMTTHPH